MLSTLPPLGETIFVKRNFVDETTCAAWGAAVGAGAQSPATVANTRGNSVVDPRTRRTRCASVDREIYGVVQDRFKELMPELQQYFRVALSRIQDPQFLRYCRGDFFRPHRDDSIVEAHGHDLRSRRVSAVLFLNRQTRLSEPGSYCGGSLLLYMPKSGQPPYIEVRGHTGLLIAFKSDVLHEVRPVTEGERYTVVTWYVGTDAA
jgi:SM-20-related protein